MSHWQPGYVLAHQVPPTSRVALEHDEVLAPRLLEADRHAEAAEAGAHDRHPKLPPPVTCTHVASHTLS